MMTPCKYCPESPVACRRDRIRIGATHSRLDSIGDRMAVERDHNTARPDTCSFRVRIGAHLSDSG
jgi:hypothetical protein